MSRLALTLLVAACCTSVAHADEATALAAVDEGDARVALTLLTRDVTVTPGQETYVGVHMALDPEWHVYFRNPGEAAVGTEITFDSDGASFGSLAWPVPKRIVDSSGTITTFGYEDDVFFVAPATISRTARDRVTVHAVADFLVCRYECIPGRVALSQTLTVGAAAQASDEDVLARFTRALASITSTPEQAGMTARFTLAGDALRPGSTARATLTLTCPGCDAAAIARLAPHDAFFPDRIPGVTVRPTSLTARGGTVSLGLVLEANPDDPGGDQRMSGLLALPGVKALEIVAPLARSAPAPAVPTRTEPPPSLALALLLAFLGGLVLNAMPCVLPVLAMKVFGLVQLAGASSRGRALHVLAYVLGILATFLVLALAVIALRAAGVSASWGFHMQEPRFVAALVLVMVLFALRLLDVLSFGFDATSLANGVERTHGLPRAFGEGVLSVALATPCSAPFLGTAVGFALTQAPHVILLVLVFVGLGLAAPFAVLALLPFTRRFLPKPGAWMVVLERLMAFLLLGTAIWLVWVVGQIAGVDAMAGTLVVALLIALAAWVTSLTVTPRGRWLARIAGTALVIASASQVVPMLRPAPTVAAEHTRRAYSEEAVAAHLREGRVVFVDFTAAWCITCKANERLVLASEAVRARFRESGAVLLVGDFTHRDPAIASVLARHGKAGVPLYLVYSPRAPTSPEVLPELLDTDRVLDAIARAEGGSP